MTKIKYLEPQHFYYRDVYITQQRGRHRELVYAAIDHSQHTIPRELPYNPAYILTDDREFRKALLRFAAAHSNLADIESKSPRFLRISIAREYLKDLIKEAQQNEIRKDIGAADGGAQQTDDRQEGLPA